MAPTKKLQCECKKVVLSHECHVKKKKKKLTRSRRKLDFDGKGELEFELESVEHQQCNATFGGMRLYMQMLTDMSFDERVDGSQ
jgi:hypothetical protein